MAIAMLPALTVSAQEAKVEKFAIKATGERSIGKAMSMDYAVDGMSSSSSAWDFGVDFGWKAWEKERHSIEANIGLGFDIYSIKAGLSAMDYDYEAPAEADMDNDTYIRHYNIDGVNQRMRELRLTVPLYARYGYTLNKDFSLHALLGFKFGFNVGNKITESKASVFSYGVYPQYDDLMIDASYLNEFGSAEVGENTSKPDANGFSFAFLAGLGAEYRVYGPISIELSARYEGSFTNQFSPQKTMLSEFDASNAPVTYTVADGQRVNSLTSYLKKSKVSKFSIAFSVIYHF